MLKLYFDWNAMAGFRTPTLEPYTSLANIITLNRKSILIPYSPAHLEDLSKGWNKSEKSVEFTKSDLKFIGDFTRNNLYGQFWKEKEVKHVIREPQEFFDSIRDESPLDLANTTDLTQLIDSLEIEESQKEHFRKEVSPYTDFVFGNEYESVHTNPELAYMHDLLPKNGQTMSDFMRQFAGYMQRMLEGHAEFKESRGKIHDGLGLDPSKISNWNENVVEQMNQLLLDSPIQKTLIQMMTDHQTVSATENPLYEKFTTIYLGLDMMGFRPEPLSPKNAFKNITTDADHAFYGMYFSYFVSNDDRLIDKAKAVYEHLGHTGTTVCTPQQLLVYLQQ
jgi:hypothetical protein